MSRIRTRLVVVCAAILTVGCTRKESPATGGAQEQKAAAGETNRVAIPSAVRQNLGITFARVEQRPVTRSIRLAGRFELLPEAAREYHAMVPGRVELAVTQYERVSANQLLYRMTSPRWQELLRDLQEARAALERVIAQSETFGPVLQAQREREKALGEAIALQDLRVKRLEEVQESVGARASELSEARSALAAAKASLAEVRQVGAEIAAKARLAEVETATARGGVDALVAMAESFGGDPKGASAATRPSSCPSCLEIRAAEPGLVESVAVTNGAWVDEAAPVVRVIQADRLRFRARALQSDLPALAGAKTARIEPARGPGIDPTDAINATVSLGAVVDPKDRAIDVLAAPSRLTAWVKPGVAAFLDVAVAGAEDELAIPLSCVARDGLKSIIFRRDPRDPDKVIRQEADTGVDDGRWVIVSSGVKEGDEIVLQGVYQLMLATSGSAAKGGHFHADGTFHEGDK